jgi:hypothetical protein
MKISDLIAELKKFPDAEIFLRDPDSGYKMPIHLTFDNEGRGAEPGKGSGAVAITGYYHEVVIRGFYDSD